MNGRSNYLAEMPTGALDSAVEQFIENYDLVLSDTRPLIFQQSGE